MARPAQAPLATAGGPGGDLLRELPLADLGGRTRPELPTALTSAEVAEALGAQRRVLGF